MVTLERQGKTIKVKFRPINAGSSSSNESPWMGRKALGETRREIGYGTERKSGRKARLHEGGVRDHSVLRGTLACPRRDKTGENRLPRWKARTEEKRIQKKKNSRREGLGCSTPLDWPRSSQPRDVQSHSHLCEPYKMNEKRWGGRETERQANLEEKRGSGSKRKTEGYTKTKMKPTSNPRRKTKVKRHLPHSKSSQHTS